MRKKEPLRNERATRFKNTTRHERANNREATTMRKKGKPLSRLQMRRLKTTSKKRLPSLRAMGEPCDVNMELHRDPADAGPRQISGSPGNQEE